MSAASNKAIVKAVAGVVGEHLRSIAEVLKSQSERIAALEQSASLADQYQGSYDPERRYARGNVLTDAGGLWLVLRDVQGERPGPSPNFRLILKGGK
jgi:hypothetical protein